MRVVIAPDSFKGSLDAADVAAALARGIARAWPGAEVVSLPVADGGEGWVDTLVHASGGSFLTRRVTGPLGEPVEARYGLIGQGNQRAAVIEMAAASGLPLVPPDRRDPRITTTRGTGELIRDALAQGARRLLVGIGGSATNDGGAGMAAALGVRLLDDRGAELPPGGAALARLARVDLAGLEPGLAQVEVVVACDVDNPLTGERGASAIYGPQKGATPAIVRELDAALGHFADVVEGALGRRLRDEPGAGAAGGLGFGMMAFAGARLQPGIELALDTLQADRLLVGASLVLTAEGRLDRQTLHGKVPLGVARRARKHGVPVVALGGGVEPLPVEMLEALRASGIEAVVPTLEEPCSLEEAMDPEKTRKRLERAGERVARLIGIGHAQRAGP
ncbi:glycerate kinase [Limnochorda pilosa]|uniref:Glycerate kinase n=1 Tax=Limnochorda pilosa TaxID=1555112 RepID=A0A0K2SNH0_LIMPI|nr:glycerate kinase [Limnochorda pilosa]BAS28645.1 glycerate kinase [Limnochorda pilosa]